MERLATLLARGTFWLTMGLTVRDPGLDDCNEAAGVALPPRQDRNEPCPCGSGSKYKRCCRERDEALRRQLRGAALPEWLATSRIKLHHLEKYASNVFSPPPPFAPPHPHPPHPP